MTSSSSRTAPRVRRSQAMYDSNILTGALLWEDSRVICELLLQGHTPEAIRQEVVTSNALLRRSKKTALNITSYLLWRFRETPESLLSLVAHSDSVTSKQAVFISSILASRFLRDFMDEVVCEAIDRGCQRLPTDFWLDFWGTCVSKEPELADLRPKAIGEIRGTLIKFLAELGIIEDTKALELRRINLTPPIIAILKTEELNEVRGYLRSFVRY